MKEARHYYVYYETEKGIFYERTCGTLRRSNQRICELLKYFNKSYWRITPIKGAFY